MRVIKAIFGRIFAIWAIVVFVVTLLLFLIPFMLFIYPTTDPTRNRRFIKYARVWMAVYLPLIGCPLRVRGLKNFAKGENYVVICNHNSLMDVPISTPSIPGANKTIAKIEMANIPLFGMMYRTGSILVDRKSDQSRKESYTKMKETLLSGMHMCIYPEGTRNKSDQPIKGFHDGAFRLAVDTRKAILPGIIFHTKKVLPADQAFFLMPHPLSIHFLPPVQPLPGETAEALKNRLHQLMTDYYVANTY